MTSPTTAPHPSLAENVFYDLGPKTFWYLFSTKSSPGIVFLLLALAFSYVRAQGLVAADMAPLVRTGSWLLLAFAAVALVAALISSRLIFKSHGFTLTPDAIKIRRGVFMREEVAIPYRQIQNIEIERTFGQQMVGLSRVIILTAGQESVEEANDNPEGILPSVDKEVALSLQDELIRRANIQKTIEVTPHN